MKEWSSLEKQVFSTHYFLTMPHLVQGGAAATDSLPTGEQTLAARLKGRNGMGWELGNERGRYKEKIIPRRREPEEWCSRGHI